MIPGMRPNQVAINDAGSGHSSPSPAPQIPEENNASIFPDNEVGEIDNPEVNFDDENNTQAISEPEQPIAFFTEDRDIFFEKISRLSDGTDEEIFYILQKEAQEKDDLGLFDEYGLMTSNLNEIIDAYQSGTDSIILKQNENGNITVKYDSDNDGVYDRTARYSTDGKYKEMLDVAGDGTNDVFLHFDSNGSIEEYARDTTNDGDYDYIEYSTEDGTNHKVVYDEKTGNIKYNDTTHGDGSRIFRWDEDPTQYGLEGNVYIDASGNIIQDETNNIPSTRPTPWPDPPVDRSEDNK